MYYRGELRMPSRQYYFGVYFPRSFATPVINTKITLSWPHKQFANPVHTLFSISWMYKTLPSSCYACMHKHYCSDLNLSIYLYIYIYTYNIYVAYVVSILPRECSTQWSWALNRWKCLQNKMTVLFWKHFLSIYIYIHTRTHTHIYIYYIYKFNPP